MKAMSSMRETSYIICGGASPLERKSRSGTPASAPCGLLGIDVPARYFELLRVELRCDHAGARGCADDVLRVRRDRAEGLQAVGLAADGGLRAFLRVLADARVDAGDRRHVLHLEVDLA